MGGYSSLPIAGGSVFSPQRLASHSVQSVRTGILAVVKPRVLVADDEPGVRRALGRGLVAEGMDGSRRRAR